MYPKDEMYKDDSNENFLRFYFKRHETAERFSRLGTIPSGHKGFELVKGRVQTAGDTKYGKFYVVAGRKIWNKKKKTK